MSTRRTSLIASTLVLALLIYEQPAGARGFGGGGRGGGGGFRGGGGGGYRGGGGFGGGGGGYRGGGGFGGGGYGGGGFSGGGYRGGGYGGRSNFGGGENRMGVGDRGNTGINRSFDGGNRNNIGIGDRGNTNINRSFDGGNRNNIGIGDRGNTNINRSFDGGNRTNFTNNRTNIGVNNGNINRINNNSGNINRVNNVNVNNSHWNSGSRWNNSYSGYHNGWVHGYWNGHNSAAWGWRGGYWGGGAWGLGVGMGLGWGLSSWGFGSSLYNWGYMPYSNPYYVAAPVVVQQPVVVDQPQAPVYDYSQPIDTTSAAPEQSVTDQAVQIFDQARDFFMKGDYAQALQLTDQALAKMPNDSALHEFRALVLFALARYDQAAASLYAVLSVGPGWDWTTLISLYPNVDVYTAQLRALEAFCGRQRDSASGRFVLAYHYLTAGHNDSAVATLRQVVQLKPDDKLSAQLLAQLAPSQDTSKPKDDAEAPQPASQTAAVDTVVPSGATIEGTWKSTPAPDTAITLTIDPGGAFKWSVNQKGQQRQFDGTSTFGDGILTLAQAQGPAMVGRVSWNDPSHITFHIVGDGPDTPGVNFSK